jgi:hypothetical protein
MAAAGLDGVHRATTVPTPRARRGAMEAAIRLRKIANRAILAVVGGSRGMSGS